MVTTFLFVKNFLFDQVNLDKFCLRLPSPDFRVGSQHSGARLSFPDEAYKNYCSMAPPSFYFFMLCA